MADIHGTEFDTATKIKLHILREYIKEWLPVFIQKKEEWWKNIFIYDFFAGEGYDAEGNPGSPKIIVDELVSHHDKIQSKNLNVIVVFNDFDKKKINKLKENIGVNHRPYKLIFEEKDFTELFEEIYPFMIKDWKSLRYPRFMFLDQYGIKYVTPNIFKKITALNRTDFLFFISSSYFQRFAEQKEFQQYLKISKEEFNNKKPYHCHRVIFNYYKSLLPKDKKIYLAPFSLRKDSGNVYGLIFGTNHLLGIEKFMKVAWNIDNNTGEANFNIDDDFIQTQQVSLLSEMGYDTRPKKIQVFERKIEEKILNDEIKTLLEAYEFTYEFGCLPTQANKVLMRMRTKKQIKKNITLQSSNIHRIEKTLFLK